MDITILGIESSCDDTSAAVIRNRTLLSNVIASQAVHQKYGGVIPELASRAHQQNIIPSVPGARHRTPLYFLPCPRQLGLPVEIAVLRSNNTVTCFMPCSHQLGLPFN
jgi:hypothetical protein